MKKSSCLLLLALALVRLAFSLPASHWRVSNITGSSAHYTIVLAACRVSLAKAGDKIQVDTSGVLFGNLNQTNAL